jgi:hypothetical protein
MKIKSIKFQTEVDKKCSNKYWKKMFSINFCIRRVLLQENRGKKYFFGDRQFRQAPPPLFAGVVLLKWLEAWNSLQFFKFSYIAS